MGEELVEALDGAEAGLRVEGGFAVAAGEQVTETGKAAGVENGPILRPVGDFVAKEEAGGVALGGVVIAGARKIVGKVD